MVQQRLHEDIPPMTNITVKSIAKELGVDIPFARKVVAQFRLEGYSSPATQ